MLIGHTYTAPANIVCQRFCDWFGIPVPSQEGLTGYRGWPAQVPKAPLVGNLARNSTLLPQMPSNSIHLSPYLPPPSPGNLIHPVSIPTTSNSFWNYILSPASQVDTRTTLGAFLVTSPFCLWTVV